MATAHLKAKASLDSSEFERGSRRVERNVERMGGEFRKIKGDLTKLGTALGAVWVGQKALQGMDAFIKRGLTFNATIMDSRVALTQILQETDKLSKAAAEFRAQGLIDEMVRINPETAGGLREMLETYTATLSVSRGFGISTDENLKLTQQFMNAVTKLRLPMEQARQELRSILQGKIDRTALIGQMLNLNGEMINKWKESGTLFAEISKRLENIGEAGDSSQVAFSNLEAAVDKLAGSLTQDLFETIIRETNVLSAKLEDGSINLTNYREMINSLAETAIAAAPYVAKLVASVANLATLPTQWGRASGGGNGSDLKALEANRETLKLLLQQAEATNDVEKASSLIANINRMRLRIEKDLPSMSEFQAEQMAKQVDSLGIIQKGLAERFGLESEIAQLQQEILASEEGQGEVVKERVLDYEKLSELLKDLEKVEREHALDQMDLQDRLKTVQNERLALEKAISSEMGPTPDKVKMLEVQIEIAQLKSDEFALTEQIAKQQEKTTKEAEKEADAHADKLARLKEMERTFRLGLMEPTERLVEYEKERATLQENLAKGVGDEIDNKMALLDISQTILETEKQINEEARERMRGFEGGGGSDQVGRGREARRQRELEEEIKRHREQGNEEEARRAEARLKESEDRFKEIEEGVRRKEGNQAQDAARKMRGFEGDVAREAGGAGGAGDRFSKPGPPKSMSEQMAEQQRQQREDARNKAATEEAERLKQQQSIGKTVKDIHDILDNRLPEGTT